MRKCSPKVTSLLSQLTNPGAVLVASGLDCVRRAAGAQEYAASHLVGALNAGGRGRWSILKER